MLPQPKALRLVTRASNFVVPAPPLGLRDWADQADAVAIFLDATSEELQTVELVSAQVPGAVTLPPETIVVVLGRAARSRSFWAGLVGARHTKISRALRCSALLAAGYVQIGAGTDPISGDDLAWGSTGSMGVAGVARRTGGATERATGARGVS